MLKELLPEVVRQRQVAQGEVIEFGQHRLLEELGAVLRRPLMVERDEQQVEVGQLLEEVQALT